MKLKIMIALIVSWSLSTAYAQDESQDPVLTLKDALDAALDQNFDIRIAKVALDQADPMAEGFALTDVWGPSAGDIPEPRK